MNHYIFPVDSTDSCMMNAFIFYDVILLRHIYDDRLCFPLQISNVLTKKRKEKKKNIKNHILLFDQKVHYLPLCSALKKTYLL